MHEDNERKAAAAAVVIESSDSDAALGGDPGNSEYIDGTTQNRSKPVMTRSRRTVSLAMEISSMRYLENLEIY